MFVLSFGNENDRTSFSRYVPNVEIKDFNVLIDGKSFFDIPINNNEETYKQIIEMGRNNEYTTGNLLDFEYFSKHCKLIVIDLSKQIEYENSILENWVEEYLNQMNNLNLIFDKKTDQRLDSFY